MTVLRGAPRRLPASSFGSSRAIPLDVPLLSNVCLNVKVNIKVKIKIKIKRRFKGRGRRSLKNEGLGSSFSSRCFFGLGGRYW